MDATKGASPKGVQRNLGTRLRPVEHDLIAWDPDHRVPRLADVFEQARRRDIPLSWREVGDMRGYDPGLSLPSTPSYLVEFLARLIDPKGRFRLLDPFAGLGVLVAGLAELRQVAGAVGIIEDLTLFDAARVLFKPEKIIWRYGRAGQILPDHPDKFDIVASIPPVGGPRSQLRLQKQGGGPLDVVADDGQVTLLHALSKLRPDGFGAAVLPESFFGPRNRPLVDAFTRVGAHVDGILSLPARSVFDAGIPVCLVIFRPQAPEAVWVGRLDPDIAIGPLATSYQARRSSKIPQLGRLVSLSSFRGWEALLAEDELNTFGRARGMELVPVAAFTREISRGRSQVEGGFDPRANSIYMPSIGTGQVLTSAALITGRVDNYYQLVLDETRVQATFMANYLGSPYGRRWRSTLATGATIPHIAKSVLADAAIFLPKLEEQIAAAETSLQVEGLATRLAQLSSELWDDPSRSNAIQKSVDQLLVADVFAAWIELLPYPLASILWRYHVADEPRKQFEALDHFFEALTYFLVGLMLSGFRREAGLFERARTLDAAMQRGGFGKTSFGTWAFYLGHLSSMARKHLKSEPDLLRELFMLAGTERLDLLASKELSLELLGVSRLRNDLLGHGGATGDEEWNDPTKALEAALSRLQPILVPLFDGWHVVRGRGARRTRGVVRVSVDLVVGTREAFPPGTLELVDLLDTESLYIVEPQTHHALELLPFVRLMPAPTAARSACYFFNRRVDDGIRWVSYTYEPESSRTGGDERLEILLRELQAPSAENGGSSGEQPKPID